MSQEAMFCFQCEQTAQGNACTTMGVCGKNPECTLLQDLIVAELIALAQFLREKNQAVDAECAALIDRSLFHTVTNVDFDPDALQEQIREIRSYAASLGVQDSVVPSLDMWSADEDIRSLKSLILFGLKGTAAYAYHARVVGKTDIQVAEYFVRALCALGEQGHTVEELLGLALECGKINLTVMSLLDAGNRERFGIPEPTVVSNTIEAGPFIVMTGHDLHDLELLLQQTEGKGVNVYTHGEMLPAHSYPELKKYAHLKGNFGTAWQNQQKEFDGLPAAFIFNTNCIQLPKESYRDRVFTTSEVHWPGVTHLPEKDFTPAIEKALELGGYAEDKPGQGINGGTSMMCGFGHDTVLSHAQTVVEAVKSGALKHIFLVGGCDGAKTGRNYYTEFVQHTPKDTLVLTLACGKYRFNDLDLGTLGGLPRLMDMGQCNDAYSAIKVAIALAEVFECGVNDLPLTLVLSWYEQKAVCILLTLLALGIKGIYLGPSLPAFISPNILNFLVENYDIHPTGNAQEDLRSILAQ